VVRRYAGREKITPEENNFRAVDAMKRYAKKAKIDHAKLKSVGEWLAKNGAMPGYGQIFVKGNHVWYVGGDGDEWEEKGNVPERKFKKVPGVLEVTYEAEAFPPKGEGWERVDKPKKYAAWRAPAGGMISRGVYYEGGKMVPSMTGEFMNPPATKPTAPVKLDAKKVAKVRAHFLAKKPKKIVAKYDTVPMDGAVQCARRAAEKIQRYARQELDHAPFHRQILHDIDTDRGQPEEQFTPNDATSSLVYAD
jgi:hypothetical protein